MMTMLWDDEPRTRTTDPLTSHLAGDRSQVTIHAVKAALIEMVREQGCLTGSEANEMYRRDAAARGWPQASFDSPRKRLGDLARDGRLRVLNLDAKRGVESEYTLLGVSV
jgi:hypothetical protein